MDRGRPKMVSISLKFQNFVFSCFVLFLAFNLTHSDLASVGVKSESDFDIDLNGPNYTDIGNGNQSIIPTEYDPKGMDGFYNMTTSFMNLISPQQIFPEGFVKVVNGQLLFRWDISPLLSHYSSLIAFVIILVVLGILIPICGLCFCCCRCCGNCGANPRPLLDKNEDLSKKIGLTSALIVLAALLLFGVISAFVSNQQLQEGTVELPDSVKVVVKDVDVYIGSTADQINVLLKNNYEELEGALVTNLDNCSVIVTDQLEEMSNATALTEVVSIVNSLPDIQSNLTFMHSVTEEIPKNVTALAKALGSVKDKLQKTLKNCTISECSEILTQYVDKLDIDGDFKLPDISGQIENLTQVLNSEIINNVGKGVEQLKKIQTEIKDEIDKEIKDVKNAVYEAGKAIVAGGSKITSVLRDLGQRLETSVEEPLEEFGGYLKEYSVYRYYPELAVCLILLTVVLCIVLGLLFGAFCRQPERNGDNCCDKAVGSCFLIIGVGMMFFIAIILVAAIIVHVSTGIVAQKLVCDTLREPNNSQVAKLIDDILKGNGIGIDIELNAVLSSCNQNLSFYNVFNLENLFNIDEILTYLEKFDITKLLDDLISKIQTNTDITLLSPDAEEELNKLKSSGIANINYTLFIDKLDSNITSIDLNLLAGKLDELSGILQNLGSSEAQGELTKAAEELRSYQNTYVIPMITTAKKTRVVAKNLMEGLKFGKESFEAAITTLIAEVKAAEIYLKDNGVKDLAEIAHDFAGKITKLIETYLHRVVDNTKKNVGQCGPLSAGINSTLIATCDRILLPWNGFWFSLFWCLLFFIPTIICSVMLATTYKKSKQFQGLQTYNGSSNKQPKFKIMKKKVQKTYGQDASRHSNAPQGRSVGPFGVNRYGPQTAKRDVWWISNQIPKSSN